MSKKQTPIILAVEEPVQIVAGESKEGKVGPPTFNATAYTGGAMEVEGYDLPVVVDLDGMEFGNSLIANLDHDRSLRVGHVTEKINAGGKLMLGGVVSSTSAAAKEVVSDSNNGFPWQASIEARPITLVEVAKGKTFEANGRTFEGPAYWVQKSKLRGFAFVPHGADDNTSATIAAAAASRGKKMKAECTTWIQSLGFDPEALSAEQAANLEADFDGREGRRKSRSETTNNPFEERKIEAKRRREIREIADRHIELRNSDEEEINAIERMHDHAIETKMTSKDFRLELFESSIPPAHTIYNSRIRSERAINDRVLQAAACTAGGLKSLDESFTDQELQLAHDHFPHGISLGEMFITAAEANGYHGRSGGKVTREIHNAAFGLGAPQSRIMANAFSTINISNVVAATANKFLHEGWMAVDLTPLRIAAIRPVNNFHQITTVSLTGHLQFEKVGADGEIKHGTLGDLTYTNQADTYASLLAITRRDIINDDLGALTAVPRRLGRGGALKLNDIFWTEFLGLVSAGFFATGNNNINTGVADMTLGGLEATETIFMNQTDPDGKPLALMPKIILVPTALKAKAVALCSDQGNVLITGASATIPAVNVFAGRFVVESSPYISNASYTGNTSVAWWMLADPNEAAVIEIVALNGRIEPVVETADADFNVLGVQMRGYNDVGVNEQEKRAGVHADGGSS